MTSNKFSFQLLDKVLQETDVMDDVVQKMMVDTVKIWLDAHHRKKDEYSVQETCKTAYEIIRWNAGLPEKDSRKKDLSDIKFWSSLNSLLNTYADKWLSKEEGESYIEALKNGDVPSKVAWKIRTFCNERRGWLGLAKNDTLVDDMCQQVYAKLFANKKAALEDVEHPGTLWGYFRKIIDRLFSNSFPKLTFTEEFKRNAKKEKNEKESFSYAHLSLYSWHPAELEGIMIGESLYFERIAPKLRTLIEMYYKPSDEDSPGGNVAEYNTAIKKELWKMFDSIREERLKEEKSFPLENEDKNISLSYNCTYAESYLLTLANTTELDEILTPGEELPDHIKHNPSDGLIPPSDPAPEIGYSPLSNTEALAILEEAFGLDDSEEVRVYKIACLFNTRLYKAKRDAELSRKYAYKLEDLKVFKSDCERGSKDYMINLTKANNRIFDRLAKGARMAIAQKRVSDEDVIKMIRFFRNCDFISFYNQERNTHYENI